MREAVLAGLAVTAAITLGAYVVYARAWAGAVQEARTHLAGLATWLARAHGTALRAAAHDPGSVEGVLQQLRAAKADSPALWRIYFFVLEPGGIPRLILDTRSGTTGPPRHIAAAGKEWLERGASRLGWSIHDDTGTSAFSTLPPTADGAALLGVEMDPRPLEASMATVREAFWLTSALAGLLGFGSGLVVLRVRRRSASAQAALIETRRIEEAVIASLGEVVYLYDPGADHLRWRGDVERVLGFREAELGTTRDAWTSRLHPDDVSGYRRAVSRALAQREPMEREYRVRHPDASTRWLLDRGRPVELEDGRCILVGSLIDRTSRREAEEAQRLFFEETGTAHLAIDGDAIVDANPAAVALFGAPHKAALLEQPVWALWPRRQPAQGLSATAWADRVVAALETGSGRFEWQFKRLDGQSVDCDVYLRPTEFFDREVLMIGVSDITPMKRAQARLIASEQRFRDVSEAVGEFIWEVDLEGRYTYASRRVQDVLGLTPAELIGRTPFEFVPEEDAAEMRRRSEEIQRTAGIFRNFEHRVRRPDGSMIWISVSGVPSYDANGQIAGYRGASLDVTQHRAYEQELVLQKNAAEAAGRAKSSFLAMMSHEIRTPLNSVLGFADLLMGTALDEQQRDYLRTIRTSGDALLILLNDILDFSKIESGHMAVEFRATDLVACIGDVIEMQRPNAEAKNLPIRVDIAPDVPRHILTDASRLRQILINLLGNAVKFTAAGQVDVRVEVVPEACGDAEASVRVTVADSGIGISDEQRERLFRPFTQADSSTTRRFGGTGLGLAISKRLAGLLGGDLVLVSRAGPGAAFALDLPASIPSADQIAGHEGPPEPLLLGAEETGRLTSQRMRVLIVDDNGLNRKLTSQLLRQLGTQTDTAASAEECYAKIAAETFDVVLMDVQMPGTDGLEATREIRRREFALGRSPLPIVALTADAMVGDRERCLDAGMTDYLTKPLRRDELTRVLRTHGSAKVPVD